MKGCIRVISLTTYAVILLQGLQAQQRPTLPPGAGLGHPELGAPTLTGYMVKNVPCLPLKKFAADAGFQTSVSPSRMHIAVMIGARTAYVLNGKTGMIDGAEFPLSVESVRMNGDLYVPLEFYQKVFPARFNYNPKTGTVSAVLPGKTLIVPIKRLPPEQKSPRSDALGGTKP